MEKEEKICPKCKGRMELGELVDENYAVSGAQKWAKSAGSILGFGRSEELYIDSYRCLKCGFLENYALPEREPKQIKEEDIKSQKMEGENEFEKKKKKEGLEYLVGRF